MQSAAAVSAGDHRSRIPLRSGQRRDVAAESVFAVLVDEADDRAAAADAGVCPGTLQFLLPENPKVLAYVRRYRGSRRFWSWPICRGSRSSWNSTCRNSAAARPTELFGQTPFPAIGELPYLLTLGPHSFYWFALQMPAGLPFVVAGTLAGGSEDAESLALACGRTRDWQRVLARASAERPWKNACRGCLATRRWFGGKAKPSAATIIVDVVPLGFSDADGGDSSGLAAGRLRRTTNRRRISCRWPLRRATAPNR